MLHHFLTAVKKKRFILDSEATMLDSGVLNVIETKQHIFDKAQAITTLVEQCTYKQTLQTIKTQLVEIR